MLKDSFDLFKNIYFKLQQEKDSLLIVKFKKNLQWLHTLTWKHKQEVAIGETQVDNISQNNRKQTCSNRHFFK